MELAKAFLCLRPANLSSPSRGRGFQVRIVMATQKVTPKGGENPSLKTSPKLLWRHFQAGPLGDQWCSLRFIVLLYGGTRHTQLRQDT